MENQVSVKAYVLGTPEGKKKKKGSGGRPIVQE